MFMCVIKFGILAVLWRTILGYFDSTINLCMKMVQYNEHLISYVDTDGLVL